MDTIEEAAFKKYLADQKLPKHKRVGINNYIDWAYIGAREAQRWIPVEEELPEQSLIKENTNNYGYKVTEQVLAKEANGELKITRRVSVRNKWIWPVGYKITHWRPIERK